MSLRKEKQDKEILTSITCTALRDPPNPATSLTRLGEALAQAHPSISHPRRCLCSSSLANNHHTWNCHLAAPTLACNSWS